MKRKNQAIKISRIFAKVLNKCRGRLWLRNYAEMLENRLQNILGINGLAQTQVFRIGFGDRIENFYPSHVDQKKCVIARLENIRLHLPEYNDEEDERIFQMITKLKSMPSLPDNFCFELFWTKNPMIAGLVDCQNFLIEAIGIRPELPQRDFFEKLI